MVELRFVCKGYYPSLMEDHYYNDFSEVTAETEFYESSTGETWQECCDKRASEGFPTFEKAWKLYWDSEDTSLGGLVKITIYENGEEKDAPQEVYDYYNEALERDKKSKRVKLRFYWVGYAAFEDESQKIEIGSKELVEDYEGDTCEECVEHASNFLEWDNSQLPTGESDRYEHHRELERIEFWDKEKKEYIDATKDFLPYYEEVQESIMDDLENKFQEGES